MEYAHIIEHLKYNINTDEDGTICYYNKDGQRHRENDQPAVIYADGTKEWWVNDKLHRENDQPAVIYADGTKEWWVNDKLHRENNQPAYISADGTQRWWVNGQHIK
jgi:ribosomal protein L25 (general stress protein Ctc)